MEWKVSNKDDGDGCLVMKASSFSAMLVCNALDSLVGDAGETER